MSSFLLAASTTDAVPLGHCALLLAALTPWVPLLWIKELLQPNKHWCGPLGPAPTLTSPKGRKSAPLSFYSIVLFDSISYRPLVKCQTGFCCSLTFPKRLAVKHHSKGISPRCTLSKVSLS